MLNEYIILIILIAGVLYMLVGIKYKILIALFVMSSCFGLVEHIVHGIDLWDVGIVMLLIVYGQLWLSNNRKPVEKPLYEGILIVFIGWMLIEFAWSLFHYPIVPTIKAARQLLLGYMTYFVFVSFFKSRDYDLDPFFRVFFRVTFFFVILFLAATALHIQDLHSLSRDYEGVTRTLPVFINYAFLFTWLLLVRYFSGEKLSIAERVYLVLMVIVIMLTYTRSLYFAVAIIFCMTLSVLARDGKLQLTRLMIFSIISCLAFALMFSTGKLDKMISRTMTGLELISGEVGQNAVERKKLDNTYTGRIDIIKERFAMVLRYNPLMGYGFVHDDIAHNQLKLRPRSGSIRPEKYDYKYTDRFQLTIYSADVTWGNILINTGITGFVILMVFIISISVTQLKRYYNGGEMYYYQCAFFLQIIYIIISTLSSDAMNGNVQIFCLFLAGYTVCLKDQKKFIKEHRTFGEYEPPPVYSH